MGFKSVVGNFTKVRESMINSDKKEEKSSSIFFSPKCLQGGKESTYTIRFLPIDTASGKPWHALRLHMFKRAGDNKYIKFLDPRSLGNSKAENPVADEGWKLKASDNPVDQKQSAKIRSKARYITLVYIKEAPETHKEVEGQVMIFEAGEKVGQKMEDAISKLKLCFWDAFQGTDFLLSVIEKGEGKEKFPNYDSSQFLREAGPIVEDEKKMEVISSTMEKIGDIKKIYLERYPVITGKQMLELMNGGIKTATDATEGEVEVDVSATTTTQEPDFGEVEPPKTTPKSSPKVTSKETPMTETAAIAAAKPDEVEANVDDIKLDFNADDFKID